MSISGLEHQVHNITHYPTTKYSELFPNNLKDLVNIVKDATTARTKLYPFSTGYNWGMGSKLPVSDDCTLVNLSKLNNIIEYDKFSGTVIIEPGVTQEQLSKYLKENGDTHFIDVTGSSKSTSITGNALERGITYTTQRNESILGLEVLTGNAELIKTGSWRFDNSKLKNIYKYGVGANLTELFFQSNFGIVTKIIIKLQKVKKYNYSVLIQYSKIENVAKHIGSFNLLIESKVINSIFHIANTNRAKGAILPALERRLSNLGCKYDMGKIKKNLDDTLKNGWIASGFISSDDKHDIKYKIKSLKNEFSGDAKIKIVNVKSLNLVNKYINLLNRFNIFKIAFGAYPFKTLYLGNPTDAALGSVVKLNDFLKKDFSAQQVDHAQTSFAYCLPLIPMDEKNTYEAFKLINEVCNKYNFPPSITLNPIKENLLEAVVSISYKPKDYADSRECIRNLQIELNSKGYYSYRTNIKDMDLYHTDKTYSKYLMGIKNVFDPYNIISPGRYHP